MFSTEASDKLLNIQVEPSFLSQLWTEYDKDVWEHDIYEYRKM